MDPLQYLTGLVEHERELSSEFRDEMRVRMSTLEQRLAIQDALAAEASKKYKIYGGILGTLIALVAAVTPFLVH